ncbi:hypothetical protein [Konateibacter massiliensis]|uniref:hypothetical protein n=1 Tax=Konateibacter massiliensis TaxID=2002841 RepID=UPI000C147B5F|nr:hypothetical protein [Konateibacter massiliensis]
MLRYKIIAANTIEVDLMNDYSIVAMIEFKRETEKYNATMYLKRNDVSMLDLIGKQANVEFASERNQIKLEVTRYITTLLTDGFFKYYIDRYEYMMKCFDRGNELFEQERFRLHTESQVGENV